MVVQVLAVGLRYLRTVAVCAVLAVALIACAGVDDERVVELEAASKTEPAHADKEQWSKDKGDPPEGDAAERTARLAEESGGSVRYVDHSERGRAVLVLPVEFVDGETPLIVSLHGFGGDSAERAGQRTGESILEPDRRVLRERQDRRG